MPASTTSIPQPVDQGVILSFKSYNLGSTFYNPIAAINVASSDGLGQSKMKTSAKNLPLQMLLRTLIIHGKGSKYHRSLGKVDSNLHR